MRSGRHGGFHVTVRQTGFRELERALKELPAATGTAVLRRTLKKAAAPIVTKAAALAPKAEGTLSQSIGFGFRLTPSQKKQAVRADTPEIYIGPTGFWAYRGHFIEWGTKPHTITVWGLKRGKNTIKGLSNQAGGGNSWFGPVVHHPGNPPQPYMRPAWTSEKTAAFEIMRVELSIAISQAAKRLSKKA